MQASSPPFQPGMEPSDHLVGKRKRQRVMQQHTGLFLGEAEIHCSYLTEAMASTQTGQPQRRINTRDQEHMKGGRKMLQEKGKLFMDALVRDDIILFQHQQPTS